MLSGAGDPIFVVSAIDFLSGERTRGGLKGRWIGEGGLGAGRAAGWGRIRTFGTESWWVGDCNFLGV